MITMDYILLINQLYIVFMYFYLFFVSMGGVFGPHTTEYKESRKYLVPFFAVQICLFVVSAFIGKLVFHENFVHLYCETFSLD